MDLGIDPATIYLKLGLARTPGADSTAKTRQDQSLSAQPWQIVLELCQLNLQFSFTRTRTLSKDIKDQRCTVNDLDAKDLLEIVLLGRCQFIIENQQRSIRVLNLHSNFGYFSLAKK